MTIVLDMDSSASETHGAQEGTACNGHFACTCYHPLFVSNQFGDLERLSCRRFAANAVRLQLHALACNLANFLRTLALPDVVKQWSLTTLRDRVVKIGARIVRHGRSIAFQMAEVAVSRGLFQEILGAIAALRPLPPPVRCRG